MTDETDPETSISNTYIINIAVVAIKVVERDIVVVVFGHVFIDLRCNNQDSTTGHTISAFSMQHFTTRTI